MPEPQRKPDLDLTRCAGLGIQLAATIALFCSGGYELDGWLDTTPTFLLVGSLLGVASGMYYVIRDVNRLFRKGPPDDAA
mgnify:FL=1